MVTDDTKHLLHLLRLTLARAIQDYNSFSNRAASNAAEGREADAAHWRRRAQDTLEEAEAAEKRMKDLIDGLV